MTWLRNRILTWTRSEMVYVEKDVTYDRLVTVGKKIILLIWWTLPNSFWLTPPFPNLKDFSLSGRLVFIKFCQFNVESLWRKTRHKRQGSYGVVLRFRFSLTLFGWPSFKTNTFYKEQLTFSFISTSFIRPSESFSCTISLFTIRTPSH